MLEQIGVTAGWRCVDLGCGPGGITGLLSRLVGPTGHVIGVDMNQDFIDVARAEAPANVEFRLADAYATGLPASSFDLVHTRFVASTAGQPEHLLAEARRLAKSGAVIALQEPDGSTLNCYPAHPAWDKLKMAVHCVFKDVGADLELAKRLYYTARKAGLTDVHYRPFILGVRATDSMVDHLPAVVESLRRTIIGLGLMNDAELTETLAECRSHLSQPDIAFTMPMVAQVWGRNPSNS
jgi:ubiquinone/menaquinone biosynthesis C-methylase UbiE